MMYQAILFPLLAISTFSAKAEESSLVLSVYYDSYSPESIGFLKEFYKTWKEFRKYLEVDLVPYGKTEKSRANGVTEYKCPNGPKECKANIQHSCALHVACPEGTVGCAKKEVEKALHYINCVIKEPNQRSANHMCGVKAGLTSKDVRECADGSQGLVLRALDAEKSNIWWLQNTQSTPPFVTVNGGAENSR